MQTTGMVDTCGRGRWLDGWAMEIIQNGDQAELVNSDGSTWTGTVGQITVNFTGTFPEPANPAAGLPPGTVGVATIAADRLTIDEPTNTMFGNVDWQWSYTDPGGGGTYICDSASQFHARRDGQEPDTEFNDDIPIAQPINIVTNDIGSPTTSSAGWVAGSVDLATDEFDVFEFTIAVRSRLEAELSHFDPAVDDLDIYLVDSGLNVLAFSDTPDSLEMLEADLDPGTYYVAVEAFFTQAPANYVLSIDLNEI